MCSAGRNNRRVIVGMSPKRDTARECGPLAVVKPEFVLSDDGQKRARKSHDVFEWHFLVRTRFVPGPLSSDHRHRGRIYSSKIQGDVE